MFNQSSPKTSGSHDVNMPVPSRDNQTGQMFTNMSASLPRNVFSSGTTMGSHSGRSPLVRAASASGASTVSHGMGSRPRSHHNNRATSPLNLPMETLQSINAAYNLTQPGYMHDGMTVGSSSIPSPSAGLGHKSPYNSPTHSSRSSSMTSVKGSLKDRSQERSEHQHGILVGGERSLDRHLDRLQMISRGDVGSGANTIATTRDRRTTGSLSRDRSLDRHDREYPHMGARSLERDHHHYQYGRSRSTERPDYTTQLAQSQDMRNFRDALIIEFQTQIAELNKDCAKLQMEVEATKDKLSSTMNSIKTFWSPELKKERALRKEESAKYCLLNEQLKVSQAETKSLGDGMQELEGQLRLYREARVSSQVSHEASEILKKEKDKQSREMLILQKTVHEMELRLETQKQTLSARDESIKKLLEMLQSKGLATKHIDENRVEQEKFRLQKAEDDHNINHLQNLLDQRDAELSGLKEEVNRISESLTQAQLQLHQQPASTHTMQAILEAKDSRILALEREVQTLEDKLLRVLGQDSSFERKDGSLKDSFTSSREKDLRTELDTTKSDLSNKDTVISGLKLQVETLEKQQSEHQQYIQVLKEQVSAKEQRSGMLQNDLEDLHSRIKDKDSTIERKSRHSQSLQSERRRVETEVVELRDHIDIKDRKINVLQRKIENMEELVKEKDEQLCQVKSRLSSSTDLTNTALSTLEEKVLERDQQIERLKEQRERADREHQEESETTAKNIQEMKNKLDALQLELTDKQTELCELRESTAEMKSEKFSTDSKIRQLESSLAEKCSEIERLQGQLEEVKKSQTNDKMSEDVEKHISDITNEVERSRNEANKSQAEVDRLLEILKQSETEKNETEKQMKEMQEVIKEYKQKMGTLKRSQQTEKKKNAQLLEEARKREGDLNVDQSQLQEIMRQRDERIEELEEALRESVRITAEREMVMVEQQQHIEETEKKIQETLEEMEKLRSTGSEHNSKLVTMAKKLDEKESKLKRLEAERHKHLEEVYDMKQEAIQAAISEKDANIALLEMTSTKKQKHTEEMERLNKEKEKLQQQLKELTENQMRLLHRSEHADGKGRSKKSLIHKMKESTPEQVEQLISSSSSVPESSTDS